jgi:DNA-binding MarR family transcriptional regulator
MDEIASMGLTYALWRRRASRALSPFGISFSQLQLIQLARRRGSVSLSIAAEELSWDRPTTTLVARKCLEKRWLSVKRSASDRRSSKIALAGEGEELLDRLEASRALYSESLGDPLDVLDFAERAELRRMLDKVERRARDIL